MNSTPNVNRKEHKAGLTTYATSSQGILEQLDHVIVNHALAIEAFRPSD